MDCLLLLAAKANTFITLYGTRGYALICEAEVKPCPDGAIAEALLILNDSFASEQGFDYLTPSMFKWTEEKLENEKNNL